MLPDGASLIRPTDNAISQCSPPRRECYLRAGFVRENTVAQPSAYRRHEI
ncbi:hypothetical protein KCP70_06190 [Salmonella enterica subsp. enterica]|nr:hypothetical protein KCP70_06190 [Salmonella enterica subsp. enterica]